MAHNFFRLKILSYFSGISYFQGIYFRLLLVLQRMVDTNLRTLGNGADNITSH